MKINYTSGFNIYTVRFLSNFAQAAFFPFFAAWLMMVTSLSTEAIAIISGLGFFSARVASLIFSGLIKKATKKRTLMFSMGCVSVAYVLLFYLALFQVTSPFLWAIVALLLGSGLSVTSLAILSFITNVTAHNKRYGGFAYVNMALNLSSGIGPMLGSLLLEAWPVWLPLLSVFLALLSFLPLYYLPHDSAPVEQEVKSDSGGSGSNNRLFILLMGANFLTFLGYSQFFNIFPAYAKDFLDPKLIGALFLLSSIVIVGSQLVIKRLLEHFDETTSIVLGNILLVVGTLMLGVFIDQHLLLVILAVIIVSVAEVIYVPLYQAMTVKYVTADRSVLALAVLSVTWGASEFVAVAFGVYLIGYQLGIYSYIIAGIAGLLTIPLAFLIKRHGN